MSGFSDVVRAHARRYPLMEPQDYVKLAYQSEFGPEHMVSDPESVLAGLAAELRQVPETRSGPRAEAIGGGLCRYHLDGGCGDLLPLLARFFTASAAARHGTQEGLRAKLDVLAGLPVPGMGDYLAEYVLSGCPAVHHSDGFRARYQPHYRVIDMDYVNYLFLFTALAPLAQSGRRAIVAIDGRCGSGKTGLAALIAPVFDCTVLHMDDFFLPFEKRTPQRLAEPGGNVDYERMRDEVLSPLLRGEPVGLRAFDCHTGTLGAPTALDARPLVVVEGSYSHHPALRGCYDLTVFLTCGQEEQRRRLLAREGADGLVPFLEQWVPMEERYFDAFHVAEESDLVVDTTEFWT